MIISEIKAYPLLLPMKTSFAISGGTVGDPQAGAPHVYVKITGDNGVEGWGECRPSHRWSYETQESAVSAIRQYLAPVLIGRPVGDLQTIRRLMDREIAGSLHPGQPIAKAAVDMALHDLAAKSLRTSLPQLWMAPARPTTRLSYLISTRDPEVAAEKARTAVEEGYTGVDVKIGFDPRRDIEIVEAVKATAPQLFFRVDANQGYDAIQALRMCRELSRLGADLFEQPLPAGDWEGHAALRRRSDVPIALDESVWTPRDVIRAIRLEACDAIVIKLTKMGGLTGARLCGEIASAAGLALVGGGLTESRLGLAASCHLFNGLGIETPVDLNGPLFLADDPVETGPTIRRGSAELPGGLGIGCMISQDKLEWFLSE
ncbi:mandelate racemase/muconate lactonizing enzyme family protein [Cohnella sp.]|uniref:mandelate racemase/muconate lactonizing enzyme family protein n=1 Tax=Cohnella sp. TaxID=1883426 RepID=UPI0035644426